MKVIIIAMALSFPGEKGPERFYYIANYLRSYGYEITLLTSTYQHWEKRQRCEGKINSDVKYYLAYQPTYKSNLSIKRIWSLKTFADNALNILQKISADADIVYCSIPDNYLAANVMKYCKKNSIIGILDVEDLWPEAMIMALRQRHLDKLLRWVLKPYTYYAKIAYDNADAFVGTSDEYASQCEKYNKANAKKLKKTVYVGIDIEKFDQASCDDKQILAKNDEFWVIYTGTIGTSYDIKTAIKASAILVQQGYTDIRFVILGDGQKRNELELYAKSLSCNVLFLGYQKYEIMVAYLKEADVSLNSFSKGAPQSIVTKIGDYLAAGIPMINTLENEEFRYMVNKYKFGINVQSENPEDLAKSVLVLYRDQSMRKKYGINARNLAEEKFNRKRAYYQIVELFKEVSNGKCNYHNA